MSTGSDGKPTGSIARRVSTGRERFEFEVKTYAGYKDNPSSWVEGEAKKEVNWYAGRQYDADTGHAKEVLKNLAKYYPGYNDQGYEVAGFVFWQGHKDQNAAHASRYEQNLVHFIKTLRKDFDAPEAKFVLATIAFGGDELDCHGLTVANAQLAVSGETGKYPEFKGNVKTVEARPFRKRQRSFSHRRRLPLQPQRGNLRGSRERAWSGPGGAVGGRPMRRCKSKWIWTAVGSCKIGFSIDDRLDLSGVSVPRVKFLIIKDRLSYETPIRCRFDFHGRGLIAG